MIQLGAVRRGGGPPRPVARRGDTLFELDAPELSADVRLGRSFPLAGAEPVLPIHVGDFVDFYASEDHAANVGRIFRPDGDPLPPNWRHIPLGYHGRAGSVVVSGTPVRRPRGMRGPGDVGPERKLDFELELGIVAGARGEPFGVVLLNDWSAREIQRFEYQPLGPFLGKSFATSISPWITPLADLPRAGEGGLEVELEAAIRPAWATEETVVTRTNARHLHWTPEQLVAHATSNGAVARPGDLFGTGTISGPEPHNRGCLLELTWDGRDALELAGGEHRSWLEDGDEVIIRGRAGDIDLGEVRGSVLPCAGPR